MRIWGGHQVTIEEYSKRERKKYVKKRYWELKADHKCTQCGTQDVRTLSGKTRCASCAETHNKSAKKRREVIGREADVTRNRLKREENKEKRCCHRCGRQDYLTLRGKPYCIACQRKEKARQEKRKLNGSRSAYEKDLRERRAEIGVCTKCGNSKPEPGRKYCTDCLVRERMYKRKNRAILNVL